MGVRHRPRGLASRIVQVTLFVGGVTIVIAGIVAVSSISSLSAERAASRDLVALRLVEGAIDERLLAASGVLDRAGAIAAQSKDESTLADSVSLLASGSGAMFGEFAVVRLFDAGVIMSEPGPLSQKQVRRLQAYSAAVKGAPGITSDPGAQGVPEIWATRVSVTGWGEPIVVIARLDSGFVRRALENAVKDEYGRVALLLDEGRLLGSAGIAEVLDLETASWIRSDTGPSQVSMRDAEGERYHGYFYDMDSVGELSWRIVAAEPVMTSFRATLGTVVAPFAVLMFGSLLASLAAWIVMGRLMRPLRDLERTARSAASGAYVRPLPYGGDDEVGRVAVAFNDVALRLNALHDLSQLLASSSRLDHVLDGILSSMEHLVGQGTSAVYLLDTHGESLLPARTRGVLTVDVEPVPVSGGGWLAGALHETGPITLVGTAEELSAQLPGLARDQGLVLAAPLVAGNDPLGVVVMLPDGTSEISDAETEMIKTFSAQAAVAVQTSRLFEIETASRRIAEALRDVAEQLVRPEHLSVALSSVESTVQRLFGAALARILIVHPEALGLPQDASFDGARLLDLALLVLDDTDETVVLERGAGRHVEALLDEYDSASVLVAPVGLDTGHGAALLMALPSPPEAGDIDVVRALSDEVALALDNAYFYERAIARAANLETIFRISQAVASPLQINVVLNRVLDVVQKILSADAVMLWSYDNRRRALDAAMVRGDVPAGLVGMELEPGEDLPGRVFQTKQPVLIRRLEPGMGGVAGSAAQQELASLLAVPLLARGRSIGVLMVLSQQPEAFGDEDMNVLQTFAVQAALAIDTARLYSREHEVAQVLQRSLMPDDLPELVEVEAGSVYAPAGGDADIGGDYYDIFRGPGDSVWFSIGDVCGKGVHAATKTSMIKYALRALVAAGLGPAQVLVEINKLASETGDPSDIVTIWAGRYEGSSKSITWAAGGHPPAVIRRAAGDLEWLESTGPILGAFRDVRYDEGHIDFNTGDRLLLYTDGVTEARQGSVFYGADRAADALSADKSPQEDARRLLESVRAFVRSELRDDVAVLVVAAR